MTKSKDEAAVLPRNDHVHDNITAMRLNYWAPLRGHVLEIAYSTPARPSRINLSPAHMQELHELLANALAESTADDRQD